MPHKNVATVMLMDTSALRRPTTSARQRDGTTSANIELKEIASSVPGMAMSRVMATMAHTCPTCVISHGRGMRTK